MTFVCEKDGSEHTVQAPIGKSLLEVAHANDIELEGAQQRGPCCLLSVMRLLLLLLHLDPASMICQLSLMPWVLFGCQVLARARWHALRAT